ncbi:acetate/propionate family kinase [Breoghania sp.]|uniref:acetate/propionate family kinase n=1 Tax=Breoghania sp. TaxID=2065378 RepID=UPI002AA81891|nr:acetate/propionate family kinase [Breoghania sp.]
MTAFHSLKKGALLVLNSGSSSVKFTVFAVEPEENRIVPFFAGQLSEIGTDAKLSAKSAAGEKMAEESWADRDTGGVPPLLPHLISWIETRLPEGMPLLAAGHRVVHGGSGLHHPVMINEHLMKELESLIPLAPLHQPQNMAAIRVLSESRTELPQVACFDTAFHHTQPTTSTTYAIPRELTEAGIRRYGFHGLSYEYISRHLSEEKPDLAKGRVVVAHLGNGSSLCALKNGRSIDTTMGFSALEGVPMGTRCGNLDPGIVIHLMREYKMDVNDLERLLYHKSGLLGMSGISNDMRALLSSNDPKAKEAVDIFCLRVAEEIARLTCAMGGIDALVFTAGIGEHSVPIRSMICKHLKWLGIELCEESNASRQPQISAENSLPVHVIPTNEELMIARHTVDLLTMRNAA